MSVERALLLVQSKAGTGRHATLGDTLRSRLAAALPACREVALAITGDHAEVRERTAAYLRESSGSVALLVGGGSGTLRAAVEGACTLDDACVLPGRDRVRIAPLRMGSGNLVAKRLGYPKGADACIDEAAASLRADRVVPGCVMRVDAGRAGFPPRALFGMAMGGFGSFGRVASDVERGPRSWPRTRRLLAGVMGIEMWTNVEYGLCIAARAIAAAAMPSTCELVRLTHDGRSRELRLLAGLLFSFRVPPYPFDPGVPFGEAAATLHVIEVPATQFRRMLGCIASPLLVRSAVALRIEPGRDVTIDLLDRASAECFVDEDPEPFDGSLRISIAGTLALVPAASAVAP